MYHIASPWSISTNTPVSWSSSGSCESSSTEWMSDNSEVIRSGSGANMDWIRVRRSSHGKVWEHKHDIMNKLREGGNDVEDTSSGVGWSSGHNREGLEVKFELDKPDLLDSLIMEDQEQKILQRRKTQTQSQPGSADHDLPSLENLLTLLELQAASDPPPGRPITGSQYLPQLSSQVKNVLHVQVQALVSRQVPLVFPGQFSAINFKVPPPHHPPAVPASFHHLSSNLHTMDLPFSSSDISPSPPAPGSAAELLLRVEEAQWHLKALENDRKKTEAALAMQYPGKRLSSSNNVPVPRLPPGPTSLDKLLVDSLREQGRVVTLLDRVKTIRGEIFSPGLHSSLAMWKESVVTVRNMRRRERMGHVERAGGEEMGAALARLSGEIRRARSVLWAVLAGGADKM
eukprot:GFUD01119208.1.p1 GENE.GFUD01119208.1~~GFUD01119208.1.p1  ORF type:complete len:401 (-),score=121.02 GFUD01119208.1:476-1678(-)